MAKKRILKADLEKRDKLGEKLVFLCQEQIDNLIVPLGEIGQMIEENGSINKEDYGKIVSHRFKRVGEITEMKKELLKEYLGK